MAASRADMVRISDGLGRELAESLNHLQEQVDKLELRIAQLETELEDYIDGILEREFEDDEEYNGN